MSSRAERRWAAKLKRRDLKLEELHAIVERARVLGLSEEEYATLAAAVETLAFVTQELETKGTTLARLRQLLFGASTEKTSRVVGEAPTDGARAASAPAQGAGSEATPTEKPKPPGHGRNGAVAYRGAEKVAVAHPSMHRGDGCPGCIKGKVYPVLEPAVLLRVQGMAPLRATVYELDRLRCNLCGEVFTAQAPAGVGEEKYDETAASMIGLLKYGAGLPFNRIEKLERGLGIPLPATTQWEVVHRAAGLLAPAHEELIRQAAQGEVLYNDDTAMKILELGGDLQPQAADGESDERTGIFTSGIVSTFDAHQIALFFTGRKHAGENLAEVLFKRAAALAAPIQMCDALSRNVPAEFKTILSNCLAHARRRFVEVADNFPDECRYLLETLREVYHNDTLARQRQMSPEERLHFHQAQSGPRMVGLEQWLREQIEQHKVEPNSGLGEAIGYMRKHWSKLTMFLQVPGAPLDNNICERALKKAILHRKNSLFYKTQNGARVGDAFMSLIHTAELNSVEPFDYLVALQRHHDKVVENPGEWMPWNYRDTLARLARSPDPPK